ncbi:hypothetical protein Lal_00015240, partial [Lupinus albus]
SQGFLVVHGFWLLGQLQCCFVNIYSPFILSLKRHLWEDLMVFKHVLAIGLWCLLRDFNLVRIGYERIGGSRVSCRWEMALSYWETDFSNHCPIILKHREIYKNYIPFKFNNCCLKHPDLVELVKNCWMEANISGWPIFVIKEKLKCLKVKLKEWNKDSFGCLDSKFKRQILLARLLVWRWSK